MDNNDSIDENIPLFCNICPKKPRFSDTSHLLTHIASKGHLSNYFKAQVKGRQDPPTQLLVDEYDNWFTHHNIQDLLSARLCQKEKRGRKGHSQRRQGTGATENNVTSSTSSNAVSQDHSSFHPLDPLLSSQVKIEPDSVPIKTEELHYPDHYEMHPFLANADHPHWLTLPYDMADFIDPNSVKQESDDSGASTNSDIPRNSAQTSHDSTSLNALVTSTTSNVIDNNMEETVLDGTKMKGIYWQGMALFDSATAEMKRRRNQKKAFSVVQQLQATSEIVEPLEMVFDDGWTHRRTRTITGNPVASGDEDSHLEGESTPEPIVVTKKQRARATRRPLAELDPNTRQIPSRRGRRAVKKGGTTRTNPIIKLEDDDDLTFSTSKSKRRKTFNIHRDQPDPDTAFDRPRPSPSLIQSHRNSAARNLTENKLEHKHSQVTTDSFHHDFQPLLHPSLPPISNFRTNLGAPAHTNLHHLAAFGPISLANQPLFHYGSLSLSNIHGSVNDLFTSRARLGGATVRGSPLYFPSTAAPWENLTASGQPISSVSMPEGAVTSHGCSDLTQALSSALFSPNKDQKLVTNDDSTISMSSENED